MDRYQVLAISHSFTYYAAASVQHQHAFVHILDITNQVLHICSHRTEYISFLRRFQIAFHVLSPVEMEGGEDSSPRKCSQGSQGRGDHGDDEGGGDDDGHDGGGEDQGGGGGDQVGVGDCDVAHHAW